ncbi:non-ribosomal peptide synthetase, partial [Fulvivirga kasyanovii]
MNREEIYQKVASKELSVEEALELMKNIHSENSITAENRVYPLSVGQEALWIAYSMNPESYAYNLPIAYWLADNTDLELLRQSFQHMIDRHEILRMNIVIHNNKPMQKIASASQVFFDVSDMGDLTDQELLNKMEEQAYEPFNILNDPLMKVYVYQRSGKPDALMVVLNHLVFDGVSSVVFFKELVEIYQTLQKGSIDLKAPQIQYHDFVLWQQAFLNSDAGKQQESFWTSQTQDQCEALTIPINKKDSKSIAAEGAIYKKMMDDQLVTSVRSLAESEATTAFVVMLSAFYLTLHRYSGNKSLLVGTPIAGRPSSEYDSVIGYFMNMLSIEAEVDSTQSYQQFLADVTESVFDAFDHSDYPLYSFKKALRAEGRSSKLFEAAFYYQNWYDLSSEYDDTVLLSPINELRQKGEFGITLEVIENEKTIELCVKYKPAEFDGDVIAQFVNDYNELLQHVTKAPHEPLATLINRPQGLTSEKVTNSQPKALMDKVSLQAELQPEKIAVSCEENELSYYDLMDRTDRLAAYLINHDYSGGKRIGVFMDRSVDLLPVLLGILASGNTFIPLDPVYPKDRLKMMLDDGEVSLIITRDALAGLIPEGNFDVLVYDDVHESIQNQPKGEKVKISPDSLAYIIFTSGSTGRPKGVAISHHSLNNFLSSMEMRPGAHQDDVMLAVTTVCFDIAYLELFLPLSVGARVDIATSKTAHDGILLKERLERGDITLMQATPTTWQMLVSAEWEGSSKLRVLCGGEALTPKLAGLLLERSAQLWNMYGPTEATIWASAALVEDADEITLGDPVDNMNMYVMHGQGTICPPGVEGEIYITGAGLAEGYVNATSENDIRFINLSPEGKPERCYRTGDVGKYTSSGQIECLGRLDQQIKSNGYRIELEEIEKELKDISGIEDAVVVLRDRQLSAFLIAGKSASFTENDIKSTLKQHLPIYMVPAKIYWMKEFPVTLNKKIDRKSLMMLSDADLTPYKAGSSDHNIEKEQDTVQSRQVDHTLKREIIAIAGSIINTPVDEIEESRIIGEYGFDSISYTEFSVALNNKFGTKITPTLFFECNTIAHIAQYIKDQTNGKQSVKVAPVRKGIENASETKVQEREIKADYKPGDVAIVGMSGRYAKSDNLQAFWEHLMAGEDLVSEVPPSRWDWKKYFGDPGKEDGKTNSKWGSFINEVDKFDASFFGLSPRESELMDPQQRILLELAWHCFEDAGYKPSDLSGTDCGVYVGCVGSDYTEVIVNSGQQIAPHTLSGIAKTMLANRISFLLNLLGPSVVVDTACSSSLIAVHRAVEDIQKGNCHTAIAGGINVMLSPFAHIALSKNEMLSPDGRCKAFDASANGYVRGEGAGLVMLKSLAQAELDNDQIYAVIRSSSENHGGRTNSLTAPNPKAQADLIVEAYKKAEISADTISYIEAHGTGTALGDPIEINGLKKAFEMSSSNGKALQSGNPTCYIGSVKTNVGHLEGAAGIVGLQKAILGLKNKHIPASLHLKEVNPYIELENTPFKISGEAIKLTPLKNQEGESIPLRAGISSFGFGGVNAHVVLEKYELSHKTTQYSDAPQLLILSAKDEKRLMASAEQLLNFLSEEENKRLPLQQVAYTLQAGREEMPERLALIAESMDDFLSRLQGYVDGTSKTGVYSGNIKSQKAIKHFLEDLEELPQTLVKRTIENNDLDKLARLWIHGVEMDWTLLHADVPTKVSLPGYPFARERHWVSSNPYKQKNHPLVDDQKAGNEPRKFTFIKEFSGQEKVIAHHKVGSEFIMPGVGYLEMAYAAINTVKSGRFDLANIYWIQPLKGNEGEISINIKENETDFEYEVRSGEDAEVLHASGKLIPETMGGGRNETLTISALKNGTNYAKDEFYTLFNKTGVIYGPYFQVVKEAWVNEGAAFSYMEVDEEVDTHFGQYFLPPALMDGALQTAALLMIGEKSSGLKVPFSVNKIEVLSNVPSRCYVYAVPGSHESFNIALLNESGEVCVKLHNVVSREIKMPTHYFYPRWKRLSNIIGDSHTLNAGQKVAVFHNADTYEVAKECARFFDAGQVQLYNPCQPDRSRRDSISLNVKDADAMSEHLGKLRGVEHIYFITGTTNDDVALEDTEAADFHLEQSIIPLFHLVKMLNHQKILTVGSRLSVVNIKREKINPFTGATKGFVNTIIAEFPEIHIKYFDMEWNEKEQENAMSDMLQLSQGDTQYKVLALRSGQVYRKELHPIHLPAAGVDRFESGKVYLIIGGSGGLGRVLSDHITDKHQIKLIWVGRSALGEEQEALRSRIESKGSELTYIRGDIGDPKRCEEVFRAVKSAYGVIHGVVHSALELRDKRLE